MLLEITINPPLFALMWIAIVVLAIIFFAKSNNAKEKEHKYEIELIRYQSLIKDKDLIVEKLQTGMKEQAQGFAVKLFDEWKNKELNEYKKVADGYAVQSASVLLQRWKIENEDRIRKDAANRSVRNVLGKVTEHLIPFSEAMNMFNPKDIRFIGSPIDLIVFEGAEELGEVNIHFIEVKTGTSALSKRQQLIKLAIENKRVHWKRVSIKNFGDGVNDALSQ